MPDPSPRKKSDPTSATKFAVRTVDEANPASVPVATSAADAAHLRSGILGKPLPLGGRRRSRKTKRSLKRKTHRRRR